MRKYNLVTNNGVKSKKELLEKFKSGTERHSMVLNRFKKKVTIQKKRKVNKDLMEDYRREWKRLEDLRMKLESIIQEQNLALGMEDLGLESSSVHVGIVSKDERVKQLRLLETQEKRLHEDVKLLSKFSQKEKHSDLSPPFQDMTDLRCHTNLLIPPLEWECLEIRKHLEDLLLSLDKKEIKRRKSEKENKENQNKWSSESHSIYLKVLHEYQARGKTIRKNDFFKRVSEDLHRISSFKKKNGLENSIVLFSPEQVKQHDIAYQQKVSEKTKEREMKSLYSKARSSLIKKMQATLELSATINEMNSEREKKHQDLEKKRYESHLRLESLRIEKEIQESLHGEEEERKRKIQEDKELEKKIMEERERNLKKEAIKEHHYQQMLENDEKRRKEYQEWKKEQKELEKQREVNKIRVQYRKEEYDKSQQEKVKLSEQERLELIKKEEKLEKLRQKVRPDVKPDKNRVLQPTESSAQTDEDNSKFQWENGNGYSEDRLMRNAQYKLQLYLGEAGLLQTKAATELLSAKFPNKVKRLW